MQDGSPPVVALLLILLAWTTAGCESSDVASEVRDLPREETSVVVSPSQPDAAETAEAAPNAEADAALAPAPPELAADGLTPVPVEAGKATLSPSGTQVNFVGSHAGRGNPDPMARHGGFGDFTGLIEIDSASNLPSSITLEVKTSSLRIYPELSSMGAGMTPQLTTHLKSADFLDVNNYPTMTFTSKRITPSLDQPGAATVVGDLTLHDVTKEISFPILVGRGASGFTLTSEFAINRLDFDVSFNPDQVVEEVAISVIVGKKTDDVQ